MNDEINVSAQQEETEQVTFDMQEWVKQKRMERDKAFRMMDGMAERVRDRGDDLRNFMELMVRFPSYSVGNLLLIAAQKPDATDLRDFNTWKSLGTSIKKGETGILLLEPGSEYTRRDGTTAVSYNTKRLFDVSQTRALRNPPVKFPTNSSKLFRALMEISPCDIIVDEEMNIWKHQDAVFDEENGNIRIAITNDTGRLLNPLVREISKAYMAAGDGSPQHADIATKCISYVVSRRKGIELEENWNFSSVISGMKGLEVRQVKRVLGRIRDVSSAILEDMDSYFRSQREEPVTEVVR